jgi:hypothetical protein
LLIENNVRLLLITGRKMMHKRIVTLIILGPMVDEACTPQSPTVTINTILPTTVTQTTTVLLPAITGAPEVTQVFATPSSQVILPIITPGTVEEGEGISPAYDIYIGRNLVEVACGWDTNAGGFSHVTWVSVFYNVRFSTPPADWPFNEPFPGDIYSGDQESTTELADYGYCPEYEGDQVYQCAVTEGPNPFETTIYVDTPEPVELDLVPVPLVGTPDPLDDGPVMGLHYSALEVGVTVIFAGTPLGSCDGIGVLGGWPAPQTFPISWQRVVLGEEFIKEFGYVYDDGSKETYTVHFIPIINK